MFQVDPKGNSLQPLQPHSFKDLGIGERAHLQEWIESRPDALGEDLLILYKEFGGLTGTRSRVDLLALDKQGCLVVIETKLDRCGIDIIWQAAKYAAHAAAMDTNTIVDAHQRYLDRAQVGEDARARISGFLGDRDLEKNGLNPTEGQRIILVAGGFPNEVGATVLWLRDQGLAIQCFVARPVTSGASLLLDLKQIIPGPNDTEYRPKPMPLKTRRRRPSMRPRLPVPEEIGAYRLEFWTHVLTMMREAGVYLFAKAAPSTELWVGASAGQPNSAFRLAVGKSFAQVGFRFEHADRASNNAPFQRLLTNRAAIEADFGASLTWRAPRNTPVRSVLFTDNFDTGDRGQWPEIALWFIEHMSKLERALERLPAK